MTAQFARGPQPRATSQPQNAPHAALLIDFDNVTMGIRSDLTKELKSLLNSDVIKGKVAVQRAYADWRRYPQYIVPLAENSVDLIFAPAYGSSKKNATDIRLAIDALELVFTRPEIGTFILLSGDSDFSSLVLKLKEYGKYVIGVGIRESSSDLLVQNCDEYYSYSGLTGLTRAGDETPGEAFDPWELVEIAVRQMADQKDVMRSDRLKQILLELDPNFDEKGLGFPKFNRFVQEAANRGLLHLKKMENGQFEVLPVEPGAPPPPPEPAPPPRSRSRRATVRVEPIEPEALTPAPAESEPPARPVALPAVAAQAPAVETPTAPVELTSDLREAYELLQRAVADLTRGKGAPARDSDVKRRMLELRPGFDEGVYGFSKFSRFLRQAHDTEAINLIKLENGSYEVALGGGGARIEPPAGARTEREPEAERPRGRGRDRGRSRDRGRDRERGPQREREPEPAIAPIVAETIPAPPKPAVSEKVAASAVKTAAPAELAQPVVAPPKPGIALGFRRGSRGGQAPPAPPPILAGQTVAPRAPVVAPEPVAAPVAAEEPAAAPRSSRRVKVEDTAATDGKSGPSSFDQLELPRGADAVAERLASYRGVGRKSAEATVQAFGEDVFRVLHEQPDRVRQTMGGRRAEQLLKGWQLDYAALTGAEKKARSPRKRRKPAKSTVADVAAAEPVAKAQRGGPRRSGRKRAPSPAK